MAVKMAAAAWLQVLPVILLLGSQTSLLSLFGVGPAPVAAADRSKWHIPIPSVSVQKQLAWRNKGVGLRRPKGSMKVPQKSASKGVELPGASVCLVNGDPLSWSGKPCTSVGRLPGMSLPLQKQRRVVERFLNSRVRENFQCLS